jgi:hypothetical protein
MPLAILTAIQQALAHDRSFWDFLLDFGVGARLLVAAPLFIFAEWMCLPHYSRIVLHFLDSGIVQGDDRNRLRTALDRTTRRLNSIWLEIIAVVFAYALIAWLIWMIPAADLPRWQVYQGTSGPAFTFAGQWHAFISLPIFLVLLFGWLCRQLAWCRLLWVISRMKLRLIASHPDRAAGLKFVTTGIRGYWPLGFGFAAVAAGRAGNTLAAGGTLFESRYLIAGVLVLVLVFVLIPFIVFVPKLRAIRRQGTFEYGALGRAVGEQFELKWLDKRTRITDETLEVPDFSATTDLNSIIGNVHQIDYFLFDWRGIRELMIVTLLPFVPVLLAAMPLDTIIRELGKLLV